MTLFLTYSCELSAEFTEESAEWKESAECRGKRG